LLDCFGPRVRYLALKQAQIAQVSSIKDVGTGGYYVTRNFSYFSVIVILWLDISTNKGNKKIIQKFDILGKYQLEDRRWWEVDIQMDLDEISAVLSYSAPKLYLNFRESLSECFRLIVDRIHCSRLQPVNKEHELRKSLIRFVLPGGALSWICDVISKRGTENVRTANGRRPIQHSLYWACL
jgi:hypothetical protein